MFLNTSELKLLLFKLLLTFSFLATLQVNAETVKINKQYLECQRIDAKTMHLKCGESLVIYSDETYFLINKNKDEVSYQAVSEVKRGKLSLYEVPEDKVLGVNQMLSGKKNGFYERFQYEVYFKNILDNIDYPLAKSFVKVLSNNFKKFELPPMVNFKAKDKQLRCEENKIKKLSKENLEYEKRNQVKIRCPLYLCTNDLGEKSVLYLPDVKTFNSPYFFDLNKGKEIYLDGDFLISAEGTKEIILPLKEKEIKKLESSSKKNMKSDSLLEEDFYSNKLLPWKDLYKFFSNNENKKNLEEYQKLCQSNELDEYLKETSKLSDRLREDLSKEDLEHLIMVVNNILYGVFVPKEKVLDLGCLYNGQLLTVNAYEYRVKLERLNDSFTNSVLTEADVQRLFNEAKNMKDIPYGYKYDGCYARAHLLARRFEEKGIQTEKIWVKGKLSVPNSDVNWNFHVAPVVSIIDPITKAVKKMVIDPSLADKALTPEEWLGKMNQNVVGRLHYTKFPFPSNAAGFERTAVAYSSSDQYKPEDPITMTEKEKILDMKKTLKDYLFAEKHKLKPIY